MDHRASHLAYGLADLLIAFASVAAFLWSRRQPLRDARPTPPFVLVSFGLFTVVLILAGEP
jgi:hypothetical protein